MRLPDPVLRLLQVVSSITALILNPIRRVVPSVGGLDLSPILVFVIINVLEILLRGLGQGLGLPAGLVLGF